MAARSIVGNFSTSTDAAMKRTTGPSALMPGNVGVG